MVLVLQKWSWLHHCNGVILVGVLLRRRFANCQDETPRVKTYYAVHLWYREHPADVVYDPITIRHLNTTAAEVLRLVYYEDSRLLPPISDTSTVDNTTGP